MRMVRWLFNGPKVVSGDPDCLMVLYSLRQILGIL